MFCNCINNVICVIFNHTCTCISTLLLAEMYIISRARNRKNILSAIRIYFGNSIIFWLVIPPFVWPSKYFLACQFPILACHLSLGTLLFCVTCLQTHGQVRLGSNLSEPFPIASGVKQGCILASTLITIFLSLMLKQATEGLEDEDTVYSLSPRQQSVQLQVTAGPLKDHGATDLGPRLH